MQELEELWNKCLESTGNFDELKKHFPFTELEATELEQFIKLCDNRIDQSKTFLYATVILFGFGLTSFLIIFPTVYTITLPPFTLEIPGSRFFIQIMMLSVMVLLMLSYLVYLFVKIRKYTKHEIGWSAVKEMALMNYTEKVKE